jgi:glutaredoxin
MLRRLLALVLLFALCLGACKKRDDGADPGGGETLPPLILKDDTTELLLTWIDGRGDTHTAVRIEDVPMEGRSPVRVVVKAAGQGLVFYVADLTLKQGDGSYAVRTMSRSEWEGLLEARRAKANPPVAHGGGANGPDGGAPTPSGSPRTKGAAYAIVYGAEWCGPCHQAKDYLEGRGVAVTFYDIEKEPKRAAEMQKKLRDAGRRGGNIPVIDVGGQIFVGFNPRAVDKALADAKPASGTPI